MNLLAFLPRTSRLGILALATLLLLSIAVPAPAAGQTVGDCDADPVFCAMIFNNQCFYNPTQVCFTNPVPMCIYYEIHPPSPLPGWGAGIYCWLS